MYNLGEIKGFSPKSCYLRPLSNFFMNVMKKPGTNLPEGRVPGATCSDGETLFLAFTNARQEDVAKISKLPRARAQCRSGPDNNMGSKRNHHSIVPFFNNNSPPPRQFLCDKTHLKK